MLIKTLDDIYIELQKDDVNVQTIYSWSHDKKTLGKLKKMQLGRIWFNLILPDDFELIDYEVPGKKINDIISKIIDQYKPEQISEYLSIIVKETTKLGTIEVSSFNENSFILPKFIQDERKKLNLNMSDSEFVNTSKEIATKFLDYLKTENQGLYEIVNSGAKSSPMDIAVLVIAKGSTVDIEGNVSEPIISSQNDGYNLKQIFSISAEARNVQYMRSVASQDPGALARNVVFALSNIKMTDVSDCKTKKTLDVEVSSGLAKVLKGRYIIDNDLNKLTSIGDPNNYIGKHIKLRSPIYCKDKDGICKTCYGQLINQLSSNNIGLVTANNFNKFGINAAMKARHKSSQISTKLADFIKDIIKIENDSPNTLNVNDVFLIEKNRIIAKRNIKYIFNEDEYREDDINEYNDRYVLPPIFEFIVEPENEKLGNNEELKCNLVLPYNEVNLLKSNDIDEISDDIHIINYKKGDEVINAKHVDATYDLKAIGRIIEGRAKFIKEPIILLNMIHTAFPNMDLVHIEVLISNMLRDNNGELCRHSSDYSNINLMGVSQQSKSNSWLSSVIYQNPNQAIKKALIKNKDAEMNPIEKIMNEDFTK